jgi:hypothetical protein
MPSSSGSCWGAAKTEDLIDGILNLDRVADITTILPSR